MSKTMIYLLPEEDTGILVLFSNQEVERCTKNAAHKADSLIWVLQITCKMHFEKSVVMKLKEP